MADSFLRGMTSNIPLVGTDDEIKTQLSLLLGTAQLIESQSKGLDIDFYKFVEMFEDGFSAGFLAKQNPALNPRSWGQVQKTRPRIRILKESSKTWQQQGYALIELQPDRTIEEESYLLFGTPTQLIQQCMYWMNMHKKLANLNVATGGSSFSKIPNYAKSYIYIKLLFKGIVTGTTLEHRVEKSFRLVNEDPRTISESRLNALATNLYAKFNNFTFTTGRDTYTYNHIEVGFSNIWGHFNSELDARRLFEQMLDIIGVSPEWKRLTMSKVVQPEDRFQEPPGKVLQANTLVRPERERPIASVKFLKSTIKFPHIKKEIDFVNQFGVSPLLIKEIQKLA